MDKFKEYIDQNRDRMDIEVPPYVINAVIGKIEKKNNKKSFEPKTIIALFLAVAACLIPAMLIVWFAFKGGPTHDNLPDTVTITAIQKEKDLKAENPIATPELIPADNNKNVVLIAPKQTYHKPASGFNKNQFYQFAHDGNSSANRYSAMKLPENVHKIDREILNVLIHTLNNDPSDNVKLAALESLENFVSEPYVKKSLIASLKTQTDPIIQIKLINILSNARVNAIEEELNRMYNSDETEMMIKHEILLAKQKLSL
ncbi:MAG: hypothetical protein IPK35_15590 [Saprospiraceae bacterium]|jgi:hypothetical protein|nr:hypothetical protein [Saprospiraceae bacterium]